MNGARPPNRDPSFTAIRGTPEFTAADIPTLCKLIAEMVAARDICRQECNQHAGTCAFSPARGAKARPQSRRARRAAMPTDADIPAFCQNIAAMKDELEICLAGCAGHRFTSQHDADICVRRAADLGF